MVSGNTIVTISVLLILSLSLLASNIAFADLQNEVDIFFGKGEFAFRNQQFEKAISFYDKALDLDPSHIDSLFKKGGTLLILGKSDEALELFDRILAIDPNHIKALSFKADELVKLERSQEALPLYEKILQIEPENAAALSFKADELVRMGKNNDAIPIYENALKIEPKGYDPLGIPFADKLLAIDPNNPDALTYKGNTLVMLERSKEGNTIIFGSKIDEAISYFDKALAIEPNHVDALFDKGRALIQQVRASTNDTANIEQIDEGMSFIDRVLQINPNHLGALNFKADELVRIEKNDEASPMIDKVLEMKPNNEEALFLKGRTYFIENDFYNATTYFDKVLTINPENKVAQTNFKIASHTLGYSPLDGYLDVKVRDSNGALVSNLRITKLTLLNHEIGKNMIEKWPVTQVITRNNTQYEVLQHELSVHVNMQYVFGGASHYGILYPYEPDSWILYGNYWQYYVNKGDQVTFVYTTFRPLA